MRTLEIAHPWILKVGIPTPWKMAELEFKTWKTKDKSHIGKWQKYGQIYDKKENALPRN